MKKWWVFLLSLLITLTGFSTVASAQGLSPSNEIADEHIIQLEADLAIKRKQVIDLMYGNYYQAEAMNSDISFVSPTGNEAITITERGIYPSNEDVPAAYWMIEVENISDQFLFGNTVLHYLGVQEETEGIIRYADTMIQHINSQQMTQLPIADSDFSLKVAPGSIQTFMILVKLAKPASRYSLVTQLNDDTLDVEVFTDSFGNREIQFILGSPNLSTNDASMAEQLEQSLAEFNTLEHELYEATIAYYNSSDYKPALTEFEQQSLSLPQLSETESNEVTLSQHGIEEVIDGRMEAFWVFHTSNISTDFQYATKGLWPISAHQSLPGLSDYILPYRITHVDQANSGSFYPVTDSLTQALVEPGWKGYFKVSIPLGNEFYEHYLMYGKEDDLRNIRLDIYGYDENTN